MNEKKVLYRSRDQRMLAGICGGMGEYFGIDPTLVRLVFVAATLIGGPGLIAYIVCLILIPLEPAAEAIVSTPTVEEEPPLGA